MILKASQRAGGQNLAAHLLRDDENDHVEVHELRGFASDDLHGAFKEAHAVSLGTKCKQYLFSMSLNPPPDEDVPIEVFEKTIERTEKQLGLNGLPRAIVFHEKEGRRHAHAVWSRIDPQTMTARQMSFYKTKLRDISRALYLEMDWTMPRGLIDPRECDPLNFSLEEWQRAKRHGEDPRAIKSAIQDAWALSDNRKTLENALQERGFWLAKGDRRGHVVIDHHGEVHSLARMTGKKTKDIKARLGDPEEYKNILETRERISQLMTPKIKKHIDQARTQFAARSKALDTRRLMMRDTHRAERQKLEEKLHSRQEKEALKRAALVPKGLKGVWWRVTGRYRTAIEENERAALICQKRDRAIKNKLIAEQMGRRRLLQISIQKQRNRQADLLRSLRIDIGHYARLGQLPDQSRDKTRRKDRSRKLK